MKGLLHKLKPKQFLLLRRVGKAAAEADRSIYLVGGAVRDLMLGRQTADLDLVMEGDAPAFAKKLARKLGGRLTAHAQFGTATWELADGQRLDFVSARRETYTRPGALPAVVRGNLREDAFRRDFTINAIAMALVPGALGEVVDYFGGAADLKSGRVRVLHQASFRDDPTRIFRAVRYEQRYGFRMDRSTLALLKEAVTAGAFDTVSIQRYAHEIDKVFAEDDPVPAVQRLRALHILRHLHPDIRVRGALLQRLQKTVSKKIYPGRWEAISVPTVYWMGLLDGCRAEVCREVIAKVPFPKSRRRALEQLDRLGPVASRLKRERCRASVVHAELRHFSEEVLCYLWDKACTFSGRANIQTYVDTREAELRITGDDLRALGVRSGRRIGEVLAQVLNEKLDRGLQTKAQELDAARALLQE